MAWNRHTSSSGLHTTAASSAGAPGSGPAAAAAAAATAAATAAADPGPAAGSGGFSTAAAEPPSASLIPAAPRPQRLLPAGSRARPRRGRAWGGGASAGPRRVGGAPPDGAAPRSQRRRRERSTGTGSGPEGRARPRLGPEGASGTAGNSVVELSEELGEQLGKERITGLWKGLAGLWGTAVVFQGLLCYK